MIEKVRRYREAYSNWPSVVWAIYRGRRVIRVKFRQGPEFEVSRDVARRLSSLAAFVTRVEAISLDRIQFDYGGRSFTLYGWQRFNPVAAFH
ncbi:MAG: hypothetical protein ACP5UU_05705, partial [Thermoprotei archaeon]